MEKSCTDGNESKHTVITKTMNVGVRACNKVLISTLVFTCDNVIHCASRHNSYKIRLEF